MSGRRLRVLIADDEPLARKKLRRFVLRRSDLEIVGEASDGAETVSRIRALKPDLVLLDLHMPGLNGFEVLDVVAEGQLPQVVFVTAYDEHAVEAFRVGAVDYLLKPLDFDRFASAMDRALARSADGADPIVRLDEQVAAVLARFTAEPRYMERILVRGRDRSMFVRVRDVDWIEAAGNYVRLHVGEKRYSIRATLKKLGGRLDPALFARIHRSTIVNLDRIEHLEPWSHGDQLVVLCDGTRLRMSRRYRAKLSDIFEG